MCNTKKTPRKLQRAAVINIYLLIMWTEVNKHILITIFSALNQREESEHLHFLLEELLDCI